MYYTSDEIRLGLNPPYGDVLVFERLDSTNNYIKANINSLPDRSIVCAKVQTAGRGRRGRRFISPEGGVYFSILFKSDYDLCEATSVTTCAALCVAQTIENLTCLAPKIKWVNDVLIYGKKICGILCEAVSSPGGENRGLVCGIGINLFPPKDGFDREIIDVAGAISEYSDPPCPAELISGIANLMFDYSPDFDTKKFIDGYRARSCVIGRIIDLILPEGRKEALAVAVEDDGALTVRLSDGNTKTINSGEISIKLQENNNG